MDYVSFDVQVYDALYSVIKRRIPEFRVKFKDESKFQRLIGKLAIFNPGYMTSYTSTFGANVWFPSREFVNSNRRRAFKILAHEYVHLLDRKNHKIMFELFYVAPQVFGIFAVFSVLSVISSWWLLSLIALVFFMPLPALARAVLEFRGYTMGLAINLWCHGEILDETRDDIVAQFCGWNYYKMWPFESVIRRWIADAEMRIRNIDSVGERSLDVIFNDSEAYLDVYNLVTGVEFD